MMTNAIAKRYAKALVQLGAEEGAVDSFQKDLGSFEGALKASPELKAVFASPAYAIEAKREILKALIAKMALSQTVANFLLLLLDKSRLEFVSQIKHSYGVLADELSGVVRPVLTSAAPLEAGQVDGIRGALEKMTGKKVVLDVTVDSSLIGGVVTKIGDKVFDGSVKTQLTRIHDILQKG